MPNEDARNRPLQPGAHSNRDLQRLAQSDSGADLGAIRSMRRNGLKRGVVTLCIGVGQGIALAIETTE